MCIRDSSRSKVNLQCSASASGKQHDREDTGTGQNEVTNNDSQDSDSNYQTSIDDSDVENTRTRDKRTATYHATSQSDFELLETGNNLPTRDIPEPTQLARPTNRNGDKNYIAHKFGQLQETFSSILHQPERSADMGIKSGPRSVMVNSTRENSRNITASRGRSTDVNTSTIQADVHQSDVCTADTTLKSRRLKSVITVPQNNATACTPGKEQRKPRNEHASENSSHNIEKTRKEPNSSVPSSQHTRRHTRFVENDTTSTSRRHGNHTSSDNDGSSTVI